MGSQVILEESIMQKGKPATAGSKMLGNFIAPFDATVVTRLEAAGAQITGRTGMDEFGAGGLFGTGTTAEAVEAVADGKADFALCNDYTGATSRAAAACGVCYIHPTYGTVSRYGLIPAVISMDQIGIVCKTPAEGFKILKIIAGYDPKDGIMSSAGRPGSTKGSDSAGTPESVVRADSAGRPGSAKNKVVYMEYRSKYSGVFTQIMQILCSAELSNNINRYDGIKYGYRTKDYRGLQELYTKSRTEAFGEDVKLASMIGAMVLSQENYTRYYDKAMRLRRLIKEEFGFKQGNGHGQENGQEHGREHGRENIQKECNGSNERIISSTAVIRSGGRDEPDYHALSRLCGLPSVTTPECIYIADAGCEEVLEAEFL